MKNILLINPPYASYGGVKGHGGKSAPLNLAYLASYLREHDSNAELKIIDAEGLELSFEELYREIELFSPDLVGITCPTPACYIVKDICTHLKKMHPTVPIVLGGPHPTALPEETLNSLGADIAVIGEGELTFYELVQALRDGSELSEVDGIAYRTDDGISITKRRALIEDLDELPFPAKDLLPLKEYYLPPTKRIRSDRATNMITSRGCPFSCTFCMARIAWGRKPRLRSIEKVLDEIELCVKKYNITEFSFHDELFTYRRERVFDFCNGLKERGLNIAWVCQARAGTVDAEVLAAMKEAGCGRIGFGFESGNQEMLNKMNKKETLEHAIQSAQLCKKAGIEVEGAFILGHPGETHETIMDTINFAKRLDIDTAAFFIAIPYPGTDLYSVAVDNDFLQGEKDWRKFAPVSNLESPMVIPTLTPAELKKYKTLAYRSFYLRPSYIIKKLSKIRSVGDVLNLFRGVRIFIKVV